MRRQLVLGAAAITTTLLVAFVLPLGMAVRALAATRPLDLAEQSAAAVATVVALTEDERVVAEALAAAQARAGVALTVHLADGGFLGADRPRTPAVERAFGGSAGVSDVGADWQVLVPAVRQEGTVAVIEATVPESSLRAGVVRSWLLLVALAAVLLAVAVVVADRLGRTVVAPTRALVTTARQLAAGDLDARVTPSGPPELAEVGGALNGLAGRISELLAAERERIADLSHRLRTPLTALRLDAEAVADPDERERLRGDIDALEAIVTGLIRQARGQVGRGEASTAVTDLVALARERVAYWSALAEEQDRPFELVVDVERQPIRLDRDDAEALLDVLLDNVFSHTPEGTPYWVRVAAGRLVVEDAGGGLDATRRSGSAGRGSGLGLDIARRSAAAAGGELHVRDRHPAGTRVEVRLP